MDWTRRCSAAEMIDFPEAVSDARMEAVLRELRLVNRYLGGLRACLAAVKPVLRHLRARFPQRTLTVADWGAASADIPRALARWACREGIPLRILALDFNLTACRRAGEILGGTAGTMVVGADAFNPPFRRYQIDVVMFSAFLHHFTDEEIVRLLGRCREAGVKWAVVNDLHRCRAAYYGIRLLTALFSRSPEVRHDGPLSVRKGFRRPELRAIAERVGCRGYEIAWRWAFRYSMQIRFETIGPSVV